MPKIPIYENQDVSLKPSDRGITGTVNAARRVARASDEGAAGLERVAAGVNKIGGETERLGSQTAAEGSHFAANIGEGLQAVGKVAVDYWTHREISSGAANYAEVNDNLTKAWNERVRTADPNDPSVAAGFREEVLKPTLEKFNQQFLTEGAQKWAEHRTEAMRNHFFEKTTADMMTLAGQAVANNMHEMSNRMSNTAMDDPSSVPHLLSSMKSSVDAMVDSSPNFKGVVGAKAKMEILNKAQEHVVKAGAIGAMRDAADPEATADAWAKEYPQYLSGADLKQLASAARSELRYRKYDQDIAERRQKELVKEASEGVRDQYIKNLYSDDPKVQGQVTVKAVSRDPHLQPGDREHLINVINRQYKPETNSEVSNSTFTGLLNRMRLPEGDPQKLTSLDEVFLARGKKAGEEGSLNAGDFNQLRGIYVDLQSPEGDKIGRRQNDFMRAFKSSITKSNPLLGNIDPSGDEQFYLFEQTVMSKVAEFRKAGKNPYDLFDPSKPDYMGKPETLQPFKKSLEQSANDATKRLLPQPKADTPPVPGARRGGDDNEWYIPDPENEGKFLRVRKKK